MNRQKAFLYKKNYSNYDEMLSVIKRLKEANKDNKIPLFIAIDQEGGRVNRMPIEIKNIKNVYDLSKIDEKLVFDSGMITGKMLKEFLKDIFQIKKFLIH